jgi:hypothetical protein
LFFRPAGAKKQPTKKMLIELLVYRSNLPSDATPVGPGWSFSALVVLPDPVSSWTYILDHRSGGRWGGLLRTLAHRRARPKQAEKHPAERHFEL